MRRPSGAILIPLMVGLVLGLDLAWDLLVGSTGTIAYALVDEPAHLATCAIALLVLTSLLGSPPSQRFVAAALVASVAIDLDHIPHYLGSSLLTGSLPRPYTHSLLLVLLLVAAGTLARRAELRQALLGVAFGVSAHLFRDVATGPGVAFLWPIAVTPIKVPYALFAGSLVMATVVCLPRRTLSYARGAATLLTLTIAAIALMASTASAHRIALGVYIRGVDESPGLLDRYAEEVGRRPAIVGSYKRWDVAPFYAPELDEIASRGAVPMISWEPWNEEGQGFRLGAIARGHFDAYVYRSAVEAKEWGRPILLRFGQEMNGRWAPWQRGIDGTTGPRFVAAWRHIVRIFRRVGADNVSWVWCPYVDNGDLPFMRFYPGNRWVDWLALDGFNWGDPKVWQAFPKIFDNSYRKLVSIAHKPIMIAEIGSNESGGNKARWVRRTLRRQLPRLKRVKAVAWFDAIERSDFRIDSSAAALGAFRAGIRSPLYSGDDTLVNLISRRAKRAAR